MLVFESRINFCLILWFWSELVNICFLGVLYVDIVKENIMVFILGKFCNYSMS